MKSVLLSDPWVLLSRFLMNTCTTVSSSLDSLCVSNSIFTPVSNGMVAPPMRCVVAAPRRDHLGGVPTRSTLGHRRLSRAGTGSRPQRRQRHGLGPAGVRPAAAPVGDRDAAAPADAWAS